MNSETSSATSGDVHTGTDDQDLPKQTVSRYRRFALRVFVIFAPLHLYIGWSLLPDLPITSEVRILGVVVLAVSTVLIPYGTLALLFFRNPSVVDRLVWAGSLTMGLFSSVLIFTLIRDIALLIPALEVWTTQSAVLVVVLSVIVTLIGYVNARRVAKVVNVSIPLDDLPSGLEGLTIVQLSDIHIGSTIKAGYVKGIVERTNALNPDIIAITGDVVDGKVHHLIEDVRPLSGLRARYGVYIVTGNHEYYSGAEQWIEVFRSFGIRPLLNEHVVIEHGGARLVLAGVNDYSAARFVPEEGSDPQAALAGSPEDAPPENTPKVLLAHQPRSAKAAEEAGFHLQLSGHTHGGQFWPWGHFVRMQQPFTAGLHRLGNLLVYTSRGTGYWGPPKRFCAPSEITQITLSKTSRD